MVQTAGRHPRRRRAQEYRRNSKQRPEQIASPSSTTLWFGIASVGLDRVFGKFIQPASFRLQVTGRFDLIIGYASEGSCAGSDVSFGSAGLRPVLGRRRLGRRTPRQPTRSSTSRKIKGARAAGAARNPAARTGDPVTAAQAERIGEDQDRLVPDRGGGHAAENRSASQRAAAAALADRAADQPHPARDGPVATAAANRRTATPTADRITPGSNSPQSDAAGFGSAASPATKPALIDDWRFPVPTCGPGTQGQRSRNSENPKKARYSSPGHVATVSLSHDHSFRRSGSPIVSRLADHRQLRRPGSMRAPQMRGKTR